MNEIEIARQAIADFWQAFAVLMTIVDEPGKDSFYSEE